MFLQNAQIDDNLSIIQINDNLSIYKLCFCFPWHSSFCDVQKLVRMPYDIEHKIN